jgi:hypothetical protein
MNKNSMSTRSAVVEAAGIQVEISAIIRLLRAM